VPEYAFVGFNMGVVIYCGTLVVLFRVTLSVFKRAVSIAFGIVVVLLKIMRLICRFVLLSCLLLLVLNLKIIVVVVVVAVVVLKFSPMCLLSWRGLLLLLLFLLLLAVGGPQGQVVSE